MIARSHYVVLAFLASGCATQTSLYEHVAVVAGAGPGGEDIRYLVAEPKQRDVMEAELPLLVFLHGRGEIGGDIANVKIHGPLKAADSLDSFPFLVVAPHWPIDQRWQASSVLAVVDDVLRRWPIDRDRIYITGFSLGGHGSWETAAARPDLFAAVAPISGFADPQYACHLKNLPIWSFHGVEDSVVGMEGTQTMVDAVRACGGKPGMTLYPDLGHDAWTRTYADPLFYDWLLSHARSDSTQQ